MPQIKTSKVVIPQCYAYTTPDVSSNDGWTKIGFTERDVDDRIREQTHTAGIKAVTEWSQLAQFRTKPYGVFTDKAFHAYLQKLNVERRPGTEWFKISPDEAERYFDEFTKNHGNISSNKATTLPYTLRKEQSEAVKKAKNYFESVQNGSYLYNCKPRFGKTLTSYDLCRQMNAKHVLIVTNRPAIANSWYQDYEIFFGPSSGYAFISENDNIRDKKYVMSYQNYVYNRSKYKGFIEFVSLQDLKGAIKFGGCYQKLEEVANTVWDLLIIDEAHEGVDTFKTDVAFDHVQRKATLHLSGTPFKALANDKFPSEAIYNWTYADEQKAKREWDDSSEQENPYADLPQLNMFTYRMSDIVMDKAKKGIELADNDIEEYAFDLNEFFKTKTLANGRVKFIHDEDVNKFLDALTTQKKFPFSTPELRNELRHTFWILNRVDSANALMEKLKVHPVFKDYRIVLAAGDGKADEDTERKKSYDRVMKAIEDYDRTITLSVGQLTTGVTVKPWTAVLMLSGMKSAALYMQAAFRAQNPYLFTENGQSYRKENAYVFDFDPARTLTIFEEFANDLIPETSDGRGDTDTRKQNVRELLNFFPVYGEDDNGEMIELDAEKVLSIPRHIHAKEVVERGFMSNFLFANISNIFSAPKEVREIISNMQAIEEPKKLKDIPVDDDTADRLDLNDNGEVDIPEEKVIGVAADVFGDKIYDEIDQRLEDIVRINDEKPDKKKDELDELREVFAKPMSDALMDKAKESYGDDLSRQTQRRLEAQVKSITDTAVTKEYGDWKIRDNEEKIKHDDELKTAQANGASMQEITDLNQKYENEREQRYDDMLNAVKDRLKSDDVLGDATEKIVRTVETEKRQKEADDIMSGVRDHLRGFSRTIPSFLMAYGDDSVVLANFDDVIPPDVFEEVTSITIDQFRMLRDGGDYTADDGTTKHFNGHLFDEVVFNDSVTEFLKLKDKLANYFDENAKEDIFDYIPPQKTNQIFTPRAVVQEMTDMLEKENPGCFDDPDKTFIDLYMKSGLYVAEIVKRLYRSEKMKVLYPDEKERLNHIFADQVYGLAPTEIIYNIAKAYVLGFDDRIKIKKHNLRLCDSLKYAQSDDPMALKKKLEELFGD